MKDYGAMSDFEINCAVADTVGSFQFDENNGHPFKTISDLVNEDRVHYFNPCNSWSDAGPIIQGNYLSIECDDMFDVPMPSSYWKSYNPTGAHHTDVNPLRAAMIVFLMMQESK